MSVSASMEDEDVLQLLTGEDEFDADIDEMAEEELLRDDVITDGNKNKNFSQNYSQNQNTSAINKSMDDEEEDDDEDSGRRGRFRSERIMSLASVPTRRREIPDSLDSINVKLEKTCDKNNYNNRRNNPQKYRNFNQNSNNGPNQRQQNFRTNQGLLPLPNQLMGQTSQLPLQQPPQQQQQRMILIPQNIYGQQMANNSNPMNTIHVNPHFRARMANQFDNMSHGMRPPQPTEPQMRLQNNVMMRSPLQSSLHFPQQMNTSQQMLFNPQINNQFRPNFMANNQLFNDQTLQTHQNHPQMAPQLQPQQQPLLHHPQQQQPPHHQMQMDSQWRAPTNIPPFQMAQNMGQNMGPPQPQLIPQQIPMNRPMNSINQNPMMGPTPPNFNPGYEPFQPYQTNQPLMMAQNNGPPFQPQNNFGQNFQPMDGQRFPVHQNYNKMGFNSQQQSFQSTPNQHMVAKNISPIMASNQNSPQKPSNVHKRTNFESQVRPYKPIAGVNTSDQQRSEALKVAQMRTKRAKQLLLNKKQNVVKEVEITKNAIEKVTNNKNKEIEASVGVDEEYKKKLEEQKQLREEILRKKEERRKAMAAQRLRETENKTIPQNNKVVEQKASPVRSQPQQQIATLLNRSPQPTSSASKPVPSKRIVKPITSERLNANKPVINRTVVVNNQNQKRSVLIKGLAASTTELALRKLCKPIGAIESCKICVTGGQKTAIVTFVRSQDAIQFQSKYERTLLDLSIIQVSLYWLVSPFILNFLQQILQTFLLLKHLPQLPLLPLPPIS